MFSNLKDHPKAHYISFRTCEILNSLGLNQELEERFQPHIFKNWQSFNYASHVFGGSKFGVVNHFEGKDC